MINFNEFETAKQMHNFRTLQGHEAPLPTGNNRNKAGKNPATSTAPALTLNMFVNPTRTDEWMQPY
jgi:hypothetical protein